MQDNPSTDRANRKQLKKEHATVRQQNNQANKRAETGGREFATTAKTHPVSTDRFLKAFFPDPNEPINLRFFYAKGDPRGDKSGDDPLRFGKKLSTSRRKLKEDQRVKKQVRELNDDLGVYFVVNSGGDLDVDIKRYNSVFVEADDKTIDAQHSALDACSLPTSIRIETKKSVHAYWLLDGDCTEEQWREMQRRLIHYFSGDPMNKNPSRVMRLPGYDHLTHTGVDDNGEHTFERKRVETIQFDPERRYTIDELLEAFPPVPETEKQRGKEAKPRANVAADASAKKLSLTLDDINFDRSNPLEQWKAELIVKISQHGAAQLNSAGNIDCRAYCHNGVGTTGLFCDPQTNAIVCLNQKDGAEPCSLRRIGQAFEMRPMPRGGKEQVECAVTPRTDVSHDGVLKDILANLEPVDFHAEAGLPPGNSVPQKHYCVITVQKVREVANALNCGLCKREAFTYQYNGQHWRQIEKDELGHFLGEAAGKMGVESITAQYCKFRDLLVDQFQSDAYLPPPTPREGLTLINLANGTFEISADKRELREFRREDFLTYQLPFAYDPDAKAHTWQKFLDEVLPDKDLQNIIAEYMGYCFTHGLKLEKVLLMYGEGANGKSVIFDVINALFGAENISNYGLSELTTGSEQVHNRARLANKLLNFSSELSGRYTSDTFKKMVSGEPITGRLLYGQPFTLTKYGKLAFNANELPVVTEHKHAFFRRLLIVPFDVIIPDEKQDKDLAQKIIAAELPGIFNWVLAGLERLLERRRFTESKASSVAVDRYRRDSDSVAMFLQDEGWEGDENSKTSLTELYRAYQSYCKDNGHGLLGKQKFGRRLESLGIARTEVRKQPHYLLGRSASTDEEAEQIPFNADEGNYQRHKLRVVRS
jgi:putative DNA primase/helicase